MTSRKPDTPSLDREFSQFTRRGSSLPRHACEHYGQAVDAKLEIIKQCKDCDSIRDYGGLYLVFGRYLLEPAVELGCSFASEVDVTPVKEFDAAIDDATAKCPSLEVEFVHADFREQETFSSLRPTDISILFEVLLHQENYVQVIKNVASRTSKYVCVAQPCMREEHFNMPDSAVMLQFYDPRLKEMLREGSFWPSDEIHPDRFSPAAWMWGHSTSHLISIFHGLGWEPEAGSVLEGTFGTYWEFPVIRFKPMD